MSEKVNKLAKELEAATPRLLNDIRVDLERIVKNIYDFRGRLEDCGKYNKAELGLIVMLMWSRIIFEAYGDCPELVLDPQVRQQQRRAIKYVNKIFGERMKEEPELLKDLLGCPDSEEYETAFVCDIADKNIPKA